MTDVVPRYRACGDDWSFLLKFVQADGTSPFNLTGAILTADYYVRYRQAYLARLLIGSGIDVPDPTTGLARLTIAAALTDPLFTPPDDPYRPTTQFAPPAYLTRVVIGLSRGTVHRTVGAIYLCPFLAGQVCILPDDDESDVTIVVPNFESPADVGGLDLSLPGNLFPLF